VGYNPSVVNGTASAARHLQTNFTNATGAFLPMCSVVSSNVNGQIEVIDLTSDDSVARFVGLTSVDMPAAATGGVICQGRIEKFITTFNVGDSLYVNYDGTLTNVKPDYGIGTFDVGYYVIFIGVVVKNEFNTSLKDLQINPTVFGQL
jgi:hypothetical protein